MLAANQKALTALHDAKLELLKHDEGYSHLRHDNTLPTPIARDRPPSNKILGLRAAPNYSQLMLTRSFTQLDLANEYATYAELNQHNSIMCWNKNPNPKRSLAVCT
jgi:hypothetical protein